MTTAQRIADVMGNDGQVFETVSGYTLDALCLGCNALVEYARSEWSEDAEAYVPVPSGPENTNNTIVRYLFPDGSAIVVYQDCWDIEGDVPFTMAGA